MNEFRYSDHNRTDSREVGLVHRSNPHMRLDAFEVFEFTRRRPSYLGPFFLGALSVLAVLGVLASVAGRG